MGQLVRSSAANRWPVEPEELLQTEYLLRPRLDRRAGVTGELRHEA